MVSLTKIWKAKSISLRTKKRLLQSLVFSIASYGSECWVLKKGDKKKIETFELWCYRRLLRITWTAKKTNEWVLERMACKERLLITLNRRKISFVGHVLRSKDLGCELFMGSVYGKRGGGRPKVRFRDNIKEIVSGRSVVDLFRLAQSRAHWRAMAVYFEPSVY